MRNKILLVFLSFIFFYSFANSQNDGAPPFAFKVDSISFWNGLVRLAGAVIKPEGNGPFPAIVMVHGAGPSTFNEPAFRIHANAFVRGGFAVLLYDKRGSGNSTGMLDTSDYDDLAADATAGVNYLRKRSDIIPDQIGILGRSEGGWIGTLAASRDSLMKFVILSSGSGVRPFTQTLFATRVALRSLGATEQEIEDAMAAKSALWAYYAEVARMDSIAATSVHLQSISDSLEKRLRSFARFAPQIPQNIRNPANNPRAFFRAFTNKIYYDPAPSFNTGSAALLEVIGTNEEVIDLASTIAVFEELSQNGRDVTVRTLSDVGHSLVIMTKEGPRYPEDYPEFTVRWARAVIDGKKK